VTAFHPIPPLGLELEVIDGIPVDEEVGPRAGHVLQWGPKLQLALWYGPDASLERWRGDLLERWPQARISEEEEIALSDGSAARRQQVELPAETAEGGFPAAGGGIELRRFEKPVRVSGAIAFEHAGLPVLLACTVPAEDAEPMLESLAQRLRPLGGASRALT
jgi:hypothetical protein